jgi:hypothetical protein
MRRLAFLAFVVAFILASAALLRWVAQDPAAPRPKISADDCGRALRQVATDLLDDITTPEPVVSATPSPVVSATPSPAVSADASSVLYAPECRRVLDAIAAPEPADSIR